VADATHDSAAAPLGRRGFEQGSDVYERARPSYPDVALDLVADEADVTAGRLVLDLAAGTGKLTRQLDGRGVRCVAAEPSPSMREVFLEAVPGVPVMAATAESLPLAGGSMDAVVVAQAFHWFDPEPALAEIGRVLRPRGGLALLWNERDESDPMVGELVTISKWDVHAPYPNGMDFGPVIDRTRRFGPVRRTKFTFTQFMDLSTFVEQVASRSYVQVLPPGDRHRLLGRVEAFGATLPQPIVMPYITDVFCTRSLG
jgi:SAM-dependent methyltransferase